MRPAWSLALAALALGCAEPKYRRVASDIFEECADRTKSESACVSELCFHEMSKGECLKQLEDYSETMTNK